MTEQRIVPASELARDLAEDRKRVCTCRGAFVGADGKDYFGYDAGCRVHQPLQSRYVTRTGADVSLADTYVQHLVVTSTCRART